MNNEQTMTNEEAIKILEVDKAYLYPDECYNTGAYDMAIEALKDKRSRGKWKYHKAEGIFLAYMECDKCGLEELIDDENMTPKRFRDYYKYCPNCGARMNGGKNNV